MTITVVGRQDTKKTLKALQTYFGTIPPSPSHEFVAIKEETSSSKRLVTVADANPYLLMGWLKPTMPHYDDYVFDVIASILSDGKSSRLYKTLVLDKQLVSSVDVYNGYPGSRYDNLFIIEAVPKDSVQCDAIEEVMYQQLVDLTNTCSQQEIDAAVRRLESQLVFDIDTNLGVAKIISYYQTIAGNWRYAINYTDMIRRVTCNDIQRVIKAYFNKETASVAVLKKVQ